MGVLVRTQCGKNGTAYQKAVTLYRSGVRKFPCGRKKEHNFGPSSITLRPAIAGGMYTSLCL